MAIGAMAAFSSAFMNGTLFHRLKLGDRKSTIAVSIEPLSQADIVSSQFQSILQISLVVRLLV